MLSGAEDPRVVASVLTRPLLSLLARGGEGLIWSAIGRLTAADAGIAEKALCEL